jgi:hypothetical protein
MAERRRNADPPADPPAVAPQGLTFAVGQYLRGLRLGHQERVLGSVALMLSESLETSPAYARAALAGAGCSTRWRSWRARRLTRP